MVIRNTQGAEGVLKQYEDCLREVHTVPSSVKEVETYKTKLKVISSAPPSKLSTSLIFRAQQEVYASLIQTFSSS